MGSGGPPRVSIWNQWSIIVSVLTPPWSAVRATSARVEPSFSGPPGQLRFAQWTASFMGSPPRSRYWESGSLDLPVLQHFHPRGAPETGARGARRPGVLRRLVATGARRRQDRRR